MKSTAINWRTTAAACAVGALLLSAFAATSPANAATIYACVNKKSGTLHFVTKKAKCKKSENKLSWSTEGAAGRNGVNGANGKDGAAGKEGPPGKNGAVGGFSAVGGEAVFTNLASTQSSVTVVSKNLPAGSFIVAGKVNITAIQAGLNAEGEPAGKTIVDVSCTLTDTPTKGSAVSDTSFWSGFTNIPVIFFAIGNGTLSFDLPVTTTSASNAQISCTNLENDGKNSGGSTFAEEASFGAITAVQTTQNS